MRYLELNHFQVPERRLRFETGDGYFGTQLGEEGSIPGKPVILVQPRYSGTTVMGNRFCDSVKTSRCQTGPETLKRCAFMRVRALD